MKRWMLVLLVVVGCGFGGRDPMIDAVAKGYPEEFFGAPDPAMATAMQTREGFFGMCAGLEGAVEWGSREATGKPGVRIVVATVRIGAAPGREVVIEYGANEGTGLVRWVGGRAGGREMPEAWMLADAMVGRR